MLKNSGFKLRLQAGSRRLEIEARGYVNGVPLRVGEPTHGDDNDAEPLGPARPACYPIRIDAPPIEIDAIGPGTAAQAGPLPISTIIL